MTSATLEAPPARATRRRDLLVLGILTLVLRIPALLAERHLTFDDGVFGASAAAMRAGGVPFRDVFSSQGPLFLPVVWVADQIGLHTLNGPRLANVLSGVALVLVVYLAGREITDRSGALVAAGLVAVTGSSIAVTAPLAADGPAMALAAGSVLVALRYRREPSVAKAVAMGVLLGASLCVKALVLPAAVPVGLVLLAGRRVPHWFAAVGSSVAVGLVSSLAFGFADVWDQSVTYHLDAPGGSDPVANFVKVLNTLVTRDPLLLAAAVVAIVYVIIRVRRGEPALPAEGDEAGAEPAVRPATTLLLAIWAAAMFAMLVAEHPLWRPHVSELVPTLALLVGRYRPPWKPLLIVSALVLPFALLFAREFLWPEPYEGDEAELMTELDALPDDALAISDEPGQIWRAGLDSPPWLVDASVLRTESDRPSLWIRAETILEDAERPEVCAVVAWTPRYREMPGLEEGLRESGFEVEERYSLDRRLYVKDDCQP